MIKRKDAKPEVNPVGLEPFVEPVLYSNLLNEGVSELNTAIAVHEHACAMLRTGADLADIEARLDLELVMLIEILTRPPNLRRVFDHLDEAKRRYADGRFEVVYTFADRINEICFGRGEYGTWVETYCRIIENIVTRGEAVMDAGDAVEAASLHALARDTARDLLEVTMQFSANGLGRFPAGVIELCFNLDELPNHPVATALLSDRVERLRQRIPAVPRMEGPFSEDLPEYIDRLIPGRATRLRH